MYELMNFIINNKELVSKLPLEQPLLVKAITLYFEGEYEQVISECAPICEGLLRNICEREKLKCNKNNMFDMLETLSESNVECSKIELSYLQLLRIMMNKKRHNALDSHILTYFDAHTAIISTTYLIMWYISHYYGLNYNLNKICNVQKDNNSPKRDHEQELMNLLNDSRYPMISNILSALLQKDENVDDLINVLGTSRMVILKSILALMEKGFVIWDEQNVDVIKINDRVYNNRFIIDKCLDRNG